MMMNKRRLSLLALLICLSILCPVLAACSKTGPVDRNAITRVELDDDGNICVEGELTKGFLSGYSEKKIYLFELSSAYSTAVDLKRLTPIDETKPDDSVEFTVPLTDGARSRLYSSFLLAAYDSATGVYTALTTPVSVSNPHALAAHAPAESLPEASIKGLITDQVGDALQLGISHTLLDVDMAKLILQDWQEDSFTYVYGGTTAYLNGAYLAELDETVDLYARHGVKVYLRFTLGAPVDTTPLDLYATLKPAEKEAESFAVNMANTTAARRMEGLFETMATRYAEKGARENPVAAFVVGYRVNDPVTYHCADDVTLSAYVTNYEKLVRVANTALKSHNPDGRVYVSVDHHRSAATMQGGWDVATFLSAFRDECALRGDYDWQVAGEMLAPTPSVWEENTEVDTSFYTVHSLNTLTDLLAGEAYATPDGGRRRLMIAGFAIPAAGTDGVVSEDTLKRQAASYAYAYMTCLQNGRVEALLYSAYADTTEVDGRTGLRGVAVGADGGLILQDKRPVYDVFKQVDTTKGAGLSVELTEIVGAPFTKLEASLVGRISPVTLVSGEGKNLALDTGHVKANPLFTFNDGLDHGFVSGGGLTYTALQEAEALQGYRAYLLARFDRTQTGVPGGVTVTLSAESLMNAKQILLDLYAEDLTAEEDNQASVTLRLVRPSVGNISDGNGAIVYESTVEGVSGGHWQTLSFDVEELAELLAKEDQLIMTVTVDSPEGESHELGLAGVYVVGNATGSDAPLSLVIVVMIAMILLVAGIFLLLFLRHRRLNRT